jgi:hypothetical protein
LCLSPRVLWCRSIPIPPTPMSYNISDTALVPFLSSGLCTRPFRTPVLGASRRKAEEGTKQPVLSLCSFPPSGPYPSRTFCIAFVPLLSCWTFCARRLHTNPFLSHPLFFRSKLIFEPFQLSFGALFFATGSPISPLLSLTSIVCSLFIVFFYSCVSRTQLFLGQKQSLSVYVPKRCLIPPK